MIVLTLTFKIYELFHVFISFRFKFINFAFAHQNSSENFFSYFLHKSKKKQIISFNFLIHEKKQTIIQFIKNVFFF